MSEIELLPCPFCGGEVEMSVDSVDAYNNGYTFCCDNCYMYSTYQFSSEKEAIKHWNTRKPMERIVERLEGKKKSLCGRYNHETPLLEMPSCKIAFNNGICEAIQVVKEEGGIE